jgi:hypothetical protein
VGPADGGPGESGGIAGDDRRPREGTGLAGNPAIPGTVALGPEALRPHLAVGLPFSAFARVVYQHSPGEPSAVPRFVTERDFLSQSCDAASGPTGFVRADGIGHRDNEIQRVGNTPGENCAQ